MTGAVITRPVRGAVACLRSGERGQPWPLMKMFLVGALTAVVLQVMIVAGCVIVLVNMAVYGTRVMDAIDPALVSAHQLSAAMSEQESAVLGFDATGNAAYQQQFDQGTDAQGAAVVALEASIDRGVAIGSDLAALRQAHDRWLAEYADPVLSGAQPGPAPEVGQALFTEVRTGIDTLAADIEWQRGASHGRWTVSYWWIVGFAALITVVVPLWLLSAGLSLRRFVVRPVHKLARSVREVASGDLHRAVRANGPLEFRELGADVEQMRRHIVRDLDEAKDLNERLDDQARDLSRSNRDLEQFAYVASHDLQEPLRKVSSFCQLLRRRYEGKLDARADQYIEFAVDGALRMQRLINDLLAFSRVGRTTEAFCTVDLAVVARAAAAELELPRAEAGGEIVIDELPTVQGDPGLLQALLANLIGNGIKFRRENEPPVVRLSARHADGVWEISVSDNGIGISSEYAEKVFVIFQRLHARDKYAGTGIGLALAKKIVEFHGGRIGLVSSSGPGATIRLTLPALPEGGSR